jgi:cytochrome c
MVLSKAFAAMSFTACAVLLAMPAQAAGPGQGHFNNHCRTCHSMKEGDNRLGPSLNGILGAKSGSRTGYTAYSQAMKSAAVTWDEATLDRFMSDPEAVVPNNNMKPFKGVPDAAVRKAIVEYLKSG